MPADSSKQQSLILHGPPGRARVGARDEPSLSFRGVRTQRSPRELQRGLPARFHRRRRRLRRHYLQTLSFTPPRSHLSANARARPAARTSTLTDASVFASGRFARGLSKSRITSPAAAG